MNNVYYHFLILVIINIISYFSVFYLTSPNIGDGSLNIVTLMPNQEVQATTNKTDF